MQRRAQRPIHWLLAILGVLLLASFYPLHALLAQAGSDSPAHVLVVSLGALFLACRWMLGLWGLRRYERLLESDG